MTGNNSRLTTHAHTDDDDELEESYGADEELLLEPRDPYALRSLPHRIGTNAFLSEDDIGLQEVVSEDEGNEAGLYDTDDEDDVSVGVCGECSVWGCVVCGGV